EALRASDLDWMVPGHVAEKVELLLRGLPKDLRRSLIPLADAVRDIVKNIGLISGRKPAPSLAEAVAEVLTGRLGVHVDSRLLAAVEMPEHLRVRVEVVDEAGRVLGSE